MPLKRLLTFNGLHGIISQKTVLFITTTVENLKSYKVINLVNFELKRRIKADNIFTYLLDKKIRKLLSLYY
jgi:hypothetical protein